MSKKKSISFDIIFWYFFKTYCRASCIIIFLALSTCAVVSYRIASGFPPLLTEMRPTISSGQMLLSFFFFLVIGYNYRPTRTTEGRAVKSELDTIIIFSWSLVLFHECCQVDSFLPTTLVNMAKAAQFPYQHYEDISQESYRANNGNDSTLPPPPPPPTPNG